MTLVNAENLILIHLNHSINKEPMPLVTIQMLEAEIHNRLLLSDSIVLMQGFAESFTYLLMA